ncbi:MAG TPA: tyrosine-protein phosphatase [Acetobacteraceae bacterium]|nr:tyrosine-protein phosphatase [Acetobacteraceae bacterium]
MDHAYFRVLWHNLAEIVPGVLYRSNHPTPGRLAHWVRRLGLRTVVNLRGPKACGSTSLTEDEARRLGVDHVYMAFESRGAPHRDRILRFYDIYRTMQRPALMHCKSGADRAGLAAGLAVLFEGGTAADALKQLSWRFGHWAHSRTGVLDAFFVHYAATGEGRKPFIAWVDEDYDEADLRSKFAASGLSSFLNDRILRRE